jgi:hypothetical protein
MALRGLQDDNVPCEAPHDSAGGDTYGLEALQQGHPPVRVYHCRDRRARKIEEGRQLGRRKIQQLHPSVEVGSLLHWRHGRLLRGVGRRGPHPTASFTDLVQLLIQQLQTKFQMIIIDNVVGFSLPISNFYIRNVPWSRWGAVGWWAQYIQYSDCFSLNKNMLCCYSFAEKKSIFSMPSLVYYLLYEMK